MDETTGRTISLPASHAFVVQLAASVGADTPLRGRIEHLASGSATHFESLTQLGAFVLGVLAAAAAAPPADPDGAGQEAPQSRADGRPARVSQSPPRGGPQPKRESGSMKREHENGASRGRRGANRGRAVVIAAALLASTSAAHAAGTTPACVAKKLKEWGGLRKCEATENGKALQGRPADPGKCRTKFNARMAVISAQAAAAGIACRYGVNGDGTATDYDTGLQWEQKTDDGSVHDKDNGYSWCVGGTYPDCSNPANPPDGTAFTDFLGTLNNQTNGDGSTTSGCFAGHCDWRLPAIEELAGIVDPTQGGCGGGSGPCIDQAAFGPTLADFYWSATTDPGFPNCASFVRFRDSSGPAIPTCGPGNGYAN